jgi:hypothetical protein
MKKTDYSNANGKYVHVKEDLVLLHESGKLPEMRKWVMTQHTMM